MKEICINDYRSPVGELILGSFANKLCLCDWRYRKQRAQIDNRIQQNLSSGFTKGSSPVIDDTLSQLKEYFSGTRKSFEIPLLPVGSEFQQKVWQELQQIPFGETVSYKELALRMGNISAIRAVAAANGANAISILIPCHRIIGSGGELVGYAGGLPAKSSLLKLEGAGDTQLDLFTH